jgi:hypothetical protein
LLRWIYYLFCDTRVNRRLKYKLSHMIPKNRNFKALCDDLLLKYESHLHTWNEIYKFVKKKVLGGVVGEPGFPTKLYV